MCFSPKLLVNCSQHLPKVGCPYSSISFALKNFTGDGITHADDRERSPATFWTPILNHLHLTGGLHFLGGRPCGVTRHLLDSNLESPSSHGWSSLLRRSTVWGHPYTVVLSRRWRLYCSRVVFCSWRSTVGHPRTFDRCSQISHECMAGGLLHWAVDRGVTRALLTVITNFALSVSREESLDRRSTVGVHPRFSDFTTFLP